MQQLRTISMTREESLDSYICRVTEIYMNLQATRQQALMSLINCLPTEFDLSRSGLIANCIMVDFHQALETLGHVAVDI
jgi:hypothetical protein